MNGFDPDAFASLQARLAPMWPTMTVRGRAEERTLIVLSSVSMDVPLEIHPLLPAYEERYLSYVLNLVRSPRTTVVYITSQPILPRLLDYYLSLIPGIDGAEVRSRLVLVSVGDWSPRPLTQKILERPRLLERLRTLAAATEHTVVLPFVTTELEARLAVVLGVPVYGPNPALAHLGTKTGSRDVFAATGTPHPRGRSGIRSASDLVEALDELVRGAAPDEAIVKLDASVSGFGNAVVDLRGAAGAVEIERRVRRLTPEGSGLTAETYLDALERESGIVEERISGNDFRSPSVQLRASPEGGFEVLTTHDQILGGPTGQTYFGCKLPADPGYAVELGRHGRAIAERLAAQGVIGRFAVDFVATRSSEDTWNLNAVEINLRNGGTTHPALTLMALTDGDYSPDDGAFYSDGICKHYVATDHLEVHGLRTLTPDDVLDVFDHDGLGWNHAEQVGAVLHLVSGVGVAGRIGLTAIANSAAAAATMFSRVERTLSEACAPSR